VDGGVCKYAKKKKPYTCPSFLAWQVTFDKRDKKGTYLKSAGEREKHIVEKTGIAWLDKAEYYYA